MRKIYKLIALPLAVLLLFVSIQTVAVAEGETPEEPTFLLGDMDSNGKIEVSDARLVLRISASIAEPTEEQVLMGDMNSDGVLSLEDAVAVLKEAVSIGGVIMPGKTGDNFLSDDPDNVYIKLIADTYNLNPASLVAIYSVPDTGVNYVLRFKYDVKKGGYTKSPDNLYYVYNIGAAPEMEISYTNGQYIRGDHYNCKPEDGMVIFNIVQTMVMEQYPDYFEGIEVSE